MDEWSTKIASNAAATAISRQVVGVELGALLGWMSGRVLGQYDLLVGRDDVDDAVYMVGPNLAMLERRFGFDPAEFRTWVLLHELTHRAQFTGVPWMREHFTGLVDRAFVSPTPIRRKIAEAIREAFSDRAEARQRVRDSGVFGLIASAEQREVIQQHRRSDVAARGPRRRDHEPGRGRPGADRRHDLPRCCRPGGDGSTRSPG